MKKILLLLLIIPSLAFGQATGVNLTNFATSQTLPSGIADGTQGYRFNINQTTSSITLTVPKPANQSTKVTEIWIGNKGTVPFTLIPGDIIDTGKTVILKWIGDKYSVIGKGTTVDLSGYIKLDGSSSNTTGLIKVGDGLGLIYGTKAAVFGNSGTGSESDRLASLYVQNNASTITSKIEVKPALVNSQAGNNFIRIDTGGLFANTGAGTLKIVAPSTNQTATFPNGKSGTVAYTSDLPSNTAGGDLTGTYPNPSVAGTVVKSVVLNTPNVIFSTPVNFSTSSNTATGTLTLNSQTANKFLASAVSGGSATPTFRTIVAGDLPSFTSNRIMITDFNGKLTASGYKTSDFLLNTNNTMSIDELGNVVVNNSSSYLQASNYNIWDPSGPNSKIALSVSSGQLRLGAGFSIIRLNNVQPTVDNGALIGGGNIEYAEVYARKFRSAQTAELRGSNGTDILTANNNNASAVIRVLSGDGSTGSLRTPSIQIRTGNQADATGDSGSLMLDAGSSVGGKQGGISMFNDITVNPTWNGLERGLLIGNAKVEATANGSSGAYVWSFGNNLKTSANLYFPILGKGIAIKGGTNGRLLTATLSSGTITVANTSITTNTKAFISLAPNGASGLGIASQYNYVCTANQIVITALDATGATETLDASTIQIYLIEQL